MYNYVNGRYGYYPGSNTAGIKAERIVTNSMFQDRTEVIRAVAKAVRSILSGWTDKTIGLRISRQYVDEAFMSGRITEVERNRFYMVFGLIN